MGYKIKISPPSGWKVKPSAKTPQPKTAITPKMTAEGSAHMSQTDAMQAAMDGAYHNTKMYGAPPGAIPKI